MIGPFGRCEMKTITLIITIMLLSIFASAQDVPERDKISYVDEIPSVIVSELDDTFNILVPGVYERAALGNFDSLGWFGLFDTDGGYMLEPVDLIINSCPAPCSNQADDNSGIFITVRDSLSLLFLVQCSCNLNAGPITTYYAGDMFIMVGELIQLGDYSLTAVGHVPNETLDKSVDTLATGYRELLFGDPNSQDNRQVLIRHRETVGNDTPTLLWAGDIDQDGEVDLLLDILNHNSGRHYVLYLSSVADPDELVKPVAELIVPDC
jgi:hypothetical protein